MKTKLNIGEIIFIGKIKAVIANIYDLEDIIVEVVYLDKSDKAINEDAILVDGEWRFQTDGPNGGYADNYLRLREFVDILRQAN